VAIINRIEKAIGKANNLWVFRNRHCLLEDKQVYLVITSGGTKIQGEEDFLTPWLIHMLNFFGIKKIDIVAADQMALDYEKSIKNAEEKIKELFKD